MMNWYLTEGGLKWQLVVEIVSNRLGLAVVRLYTGEVVKGRPRQTRNGLLVDAIQGTK